MECETFEARLNEALDAALDPALDQQWSRHAEACPACRQLWRGYETLLAAAARLRSPLPNRAWTERVVEAVNQVLQHPADLPQPAVSYATGAGTTRTRSWSQTAAWLAALAAGLLVAVWGLTRTSQAPVELAESRPAPATGADPSAAPRSQPPTSLREVALLVPGLAASIESDAQPTATEAAGRDWTADLSNGLKPLAHSTSGALDLMLGALTSVESRGGMPDSY